MARSFVGGVERRGRGAIEHTRWLEGLRVQKPGLAFAFALVGCVESRLRAGGGGSACVPTEGCRERQHHILGRRVTACDLRWRWRRATHWSAATQSRGGCESELGPAVHGAGPAKMRAAVLGTFRPGELVEERREGNESLLLLSLPGAQHTQARRRSADASVAHASWHETARARAARAFATRACVEPQVYACQLVERRHAAVHCRFSGDAWR